MPAGGVPHLEAVEPSADLLHALGWYAREIIGAERLFRHVTVKRRRNLARPVKRRKSAFRDPLICYDFLAMAWLGATRLSYIEPFLQGRRELAIALGLPRFCDHTTAHNFLNAFHVSHLRQLDDANERLLREHGSALTQRAPVLDVDVAQRVVRRPGHRHNLLYRWAVAFCAGEALAQELRVECADWDSLVADVLLRARALLRAKPRLVRLTAACASPGLLRALARQRIHFLTTVSWQSALAQHPPPRGPRNWTHLDDASRILDLGAAVSVHDPRRWDRAILVERPARAPGLPVSRSAILTSLLHEPAPALVRLACSMCQLQPFLGQPRWPLGEGKLPSSGLRGNAAYLRLAAIAMNILRLFARHLGGDWTPGRVQARLRAISSEDGG